MDRVNRKGDFDLLDLMPPDEVGLDLCGRLRSEAQVKFFCAGAK